MEDLLFNAKFISQDRVSIKKGFFRKERATIIDAKVIEDEIFYLLSFDNKKLKEKLVSQKDIKKVFSIFNKEF